MADGVSAGLTEPRRRELRVFALSVGGVVALLGALLLVRGRRNEGGVLVVVGGALIASGLVAPGRLGSVHRAWMALAVAISKVTTPVLMGIIYFGVLTPTGLVMRVLGHRIMARRRDATSYWVDRPPGARRSDLHRQF